MNWKSPSTQGQRRKQIPHPVRQKRATGFGMIANEEDDLMTGLGSLRIPAEQAHFDARAFKVLLKYADIRAAIMIRNGNLRMEFFHRVRGFIRRHRVRQIHANKRDVDILERAHFGNALRVSRKIKSFAAIGEHVPVAASLRMVELSG